MSYRVETASSGRAVCRAKECKDAGVKIDMGDLRLGVWVPYEDRGSWHWKHWGCVTGAQIKNMRDYLANPATGGYNWDALDGYEGDEKNSLSRAPDLQDKVRKAIEQGHVDDEDFNGDLEMNKLGEKGLRTTESKRQLLQAQKTRQHEIDELKERNAALEAALLARDAGGPSALKIKAEMDKLEAEMEELTTPSKKKAPTKKRVRGDDDQEDARPAKKRRAKKAVKKEESDSESDVLADLEAVLKQDPEEEKPAKKARGKKAVKKDQNEELDDADIKDEQVEEKPKPARKGRAKKVVAKPEEGETDVENEVLPAPSKRSRAKKNVKKEEDEVIKDEQVDELSLPAQKKSARGKKVVKNENGESAVKRESVKRGGRKAASKDEPVEDAVMADIPDFMDEAVKDEGIKNEESKDGVKDEIKDRLSLHDGLGELDDAGEPLSNSQEEEYIPPASNPTSTGGRTPKKEKAAPKASTSTRATRSRTTKK